MNKNNFSDNLKSSKGFSLVESMIAIALLSVVTVVGLKQTDVITGSLFNLSLDREIDEFVEEMRNHINRPVVCDNSFASPLPFEIDYIEAINGGIEYDTSLVYLDGKIKLSNMRAVAVDGQPYLEVTINKIQEKSSTKTLTKRLPIMADLNAAGDRIENCFSLTGSMNDTVRYQVAKRICENTYGVGTSKFNDDFSNPYCSFDGVRVTPAGGCPGGQSIVGLTYQASTGELVPNCQLPYEIPTASHCPNNWIKAVGADGTFTCANIADFVDSTNPVNFNAGDECKLIIGSDNKVRLSCTPSGCVEDITSCTAASAATTACNAPVANNCSTPCSNGLVGTLSCTPPPCVEDLAYCASQAASTSCGDPVMNNCSPAVACSDGTTGTNVTGCTPSCTGSYTAAVTSTGGSGQCTTKSGYESCDPVNWTVYADGTVNAPPSCTGVPVCSGSSIEAVCNSHSNCEWQAALPLGVTTFETLNCGGTSGSPVSDSVACLSQGPGCAWDDCSCGAPVTAPPFSTLPCAGLPTYPYYYSSPSSQCCSSPMPPLGSTAALPSCIGVTYP